MLDSDIYYIFSPQLRMRRNKSRCILYSVDDFFLSADNLTIASSYDVIFIMLFDGTRLKEQVSKDFEYLFGYKINVDEYYYNLKKRFHDFDFLIDSASLDKSEIDSINSRYDVKDFIISSDEMNMLGGDLRLDYPLTVNFNVSTECSFNCLYCYHPLEKAAPYISLERLKTIFKELKEIGIESIMLTGGDPMLRPDIDEVMEALYKTGIPYTFSTKSILTYKRLKWLKENAGLKNLQLSLDSFNPDTVEKLIGVSGTSYISQFIHMVKDIKVLGLEARIKAVLTRYNADEMSDYLDEICKLGFKHAQIVSYGRSGYRHDDSLFATQEQMENVSRIVDSWKRKHPDIDFAGSSYEISYQECLDVPNVNDSNIMEQRVVCNAGRFSMFILPTGEVGICEHLPYSKENIIGDLRIQSVMDVWNGEGVRRWLSPPDRRIFPQDSPCASCKDEWYARCHTYYSRCLRFSREVYGDLVHPDIKCPLAKFDKVRLT